MNQRVKRRIHPIPCYVMKTASGLEVEFGVISFLGTYDEADKAFDDVYAALIGKYGKKSVRRHIFVNTFLPP
jgi:hypothetical protein